jgi:hypothetical protein
MAPLMYFQFEIAFPPITSFTFFLLATSIKNMRATLGLSVSLISIFNYKSKIISKWNLCSHLKPLTVPEATLCLWLLGFISHTCCLRENWTQNFQKISDFPTQKHSTTIEILFIFRKQTLPCEMIDPFTCYLILMLFLPLTLTSLDLSTQSIYPSYNHASIQEEGTTIKLNHMVL